MTKPVPTWRFWPWRVIGGVVALVIVFLAIAYAITVSATRRDLARCRAGYESARTYTDTQAVDSIEIVLARAKGPLYSTVHCRILRGLPE